MNQDARTLKTKLLKKLYTQHTSTTCLVKTNGCTRQVWGEGNPETQLLFIGEAPGAEEDLQGKPFVGRSGKLLAKHLERAGIKRSDVFITNIVKCRPPNNRKPLPSEIAFYKPILFDEIKIIRPRIICTLGASAFEALTHKPTSITKTRGALTTIPELHSIGDILIIPTLHPAYILRNPAAEKDFAQDIAKAISLSKNQTKQ